MALGKLPEAEEALSGPPKLPKGPGGFQRQPSMQAQATPGGPAGLYLLGKINRCTLLYSGTMLLQSQTRRTCRRRQAQQQTLHFP